MNTKHLSKLRARARRLYREHEAIQVLLNFMTVERRKKVDAIKKDLGRSNEVRLGKFIVEVRNKIEEDRKFYGIKAPGPLLINLLEGLESNPPDRPFLLIPKYLLRELFDHYEKANSNFNNYPEHLRIEIDPGITRQQLGNVEWMLVEAILFEDMCALFNLAKEAHIKLDRWTAPKKTNKSADALSRATIAAAFYFVESYLNGIAFDYYIRNKDGLDTKTIEVLTESKRYLSLVEKATKYSRIILGQTHSPLNDSNCPELAFMGGKAKLFRDAIVHASPKVDLDSLDPTKEQLLSHVSFSEVESIIDNAVKLVKRIHAEVLGGESQLLWITERDQSGFFPDAAFA